MAHQKRHLASDPPHAERLAVCGACSRTLVRSAGSSPPRAHRTTPRNRSAISVLVFWGIAGGVRKYASVARCGGARPGTKIPPADEYESAMGNGDTLPLRDPPEFQALEKHTAKTRSPTLFRPAHPASGRSGRRRWGGLWLLRLGGVRRPQWLQTRTSRRLETPLVG